MKISKLLAVAAIAVAPLAAHAGAPAGEYFTDFHLDTTSAHPQFPRSEFELYVEHWLPDGRAITFVEKSREEVRAELAGAPIEMIGA
jgi:hypothetical protein